MTDLPPAMKALNPLPAMNPLPAPAPGVFSEVARAMQGYVDAGLLAGISYALLRGRDVVDCRCLGWADREQGQSMTTDRVFRVFSNSKLVTSCALLLLFEEGLFQLDDPVERYLPQLARRQVLRPGATRLDDTEPARSPITIRQLMSHSSGLSYGLFDPESLITRAYAERKVLRPSKTLGELIDDLEPLPLVFHPGTGFEYSIATDVLGRLIEVLGGQALDAFLQARVFDPLGMADTGFVVPEASVARLAAYYRGASLVEPLMPGLIRFDDYPYRGAYLRPAPRLSGGSGLVSTLPDFVALVRSLLPGGRTLLRPETLRLMMSNQLPEGVYVRFSNFGVVGGLGHGLGGAVTLEAPALDAASAPGDFQWGGIAGTHWWVSPANDLAAVVMTQRELAFWHPYFFDFKRRVLDAIRGGGR